MSTKEFDSRFQELFTALVEIAFEFVDNNDSEVEKLYIYASLENQDLFYNVFYKVNGQLVYPHELNSVSKKKYDLSDTRTFSLLNTGNDILEEIMDLFLDHNRPLPTLMKMTFEPGSGAFNNDISYDLHFSDDDQRSNTDGYEEWFRETKKQP